MLVRSWMSPDPLTIKPATTISQARSLLQRYHIRHLPVIRRDHLVGIISDRDVYHDGVRPDQAVDEVMSAEPLTISPGHSIEAAARRMLAGNVSCLPVVDSEDRLVGLITTTDCLIATLTTKQSPARNDAPPSARPIPAE